MAVYPVMIKSDTAHILEVLKAIPEGRVSSYGRVAALAGNPRGARQVSRVLHSMSEAHDLPWHRVVNAQGQISLPRGRGFELQKALLEDEGVAVCAKGCIDLARFLWRPEGNGGLDITVSGHGDRP